MVARGPHTPSLRKSNNGIDLIGRICSPEDHPGTPRREGDPLTPEEVAALLFASAGRLENQELYPRTTKHLIEENYRV
jgi:hypothetical protein